MKKHTRTIKSLLLVTALLLFSCVTGEDFETVRGTDIPVSELRRNTTISAETFLKITNGKYYRASESYCQWKGGTLVYLQTGKDYYGLEGLNDMYGTDLGDIYIQFEESVLHFYNDQYFFDDRYSFSYHEEDKSMMLPITNTDGRHLCKILYIDENCIIAETKVFKPKISTPESRRAVSRAEFVLVRLAAVNPPQLFTGYTDWKVRYPEGN